MSEYFRFPHEILIQSLLADGSKDNLRNSQEELLHVISYKQTSRECLNCPCQMSGAWQLLEETSRNGCNVEANRQAIATQMIIMGCVAVDAVLVKKMTIVREYRYSTKTITENPVITKKFQRMKMPYVAALTFLTNAAILIIKSSTPSPSLALIHMSRE